MRISLFLKQACKIGTSQLYVTWNSTITSLENTLCPLSIRKTDSFHKNLKRNFHKFIKLINEAVWAVRREK